MSPVKHFHRAEWTLLAAAALAVLGAALIIRAVDELDRGKRAMRRELRDTRYELDELQERWREHGTAAEPTPAPEPEAADDEPAGE